MKIAFKIDKDQVETIKELKKLGKFPRLDRPGEDVVGGFFFSIQKDHILLCYEGSHDDFCGHLYDIKALYLNNVGYNYPIKNYEPDDPRLKWNETLAGYIRHRAPFNEVEAYYREKGLGLALLPSRFISQHNAMENTLV